MRLGLALPQFDYSVPDERPTKWETVVQWARRAEAAGYDSVWLADHLFLDIEKYGGPPGIFAAFDPLIGLSALARATDQVRIGTLAICSQLRPPTVLGKALTTVDILSAGRLTVTMGAGWYQPEFAAAGVPFERPAVRMQQLAEAVQVLKAMFSGRCVFRGRHYQADGAISHPLPVQRPGPPVWVAGKGGDRLLEVVARHADGWNTAWAWTPERYRDRLAALEQACGAVERDPATVTLSLGLNALVGEDEGDLARRFARLVEATPPGVVDGTTLDAWREGRLVGTVEQVREQLAGWAALGVTDLIVTLGALPFAVSGDDTLELVAAAAR